MTDDIVTRLQACTPYGLDDHTVLTHAAKNIKQLRAAGDALHQAINEGRHEDVYRCLEAWREARRG